MRRRRAADMVPRVRMLCRRSASFTMMTRRSLTIARTILRTFCAWASARDLQSSWVSLLTPSTSSATSSPNSWRSCSLVTGVSSMTSCSSAAMMPLASMHISARIRATASG